jgi:hypothetical protein
VYVLFGMGIGVYDGVAAAAGAFFLSRSARASSRFLFGPASFGFIFNAAS